MQKKHPELFEDGELYHLYFIFLFFGLYHRSSRIRGQIILRRVECDALKIKI
jgi:hypothetical protein